MRDKLKITGPPTNISSVIGYRSVVCSLGVCHSGLCCSCVCFAFGRRSDPDGSSHPDCANDIVDEICFYFCSFGDRGFYFCPFAFGNGFGNGLASGTRSLASEPLPFGLH